MYVGNEPCLHSGSEQGSKCPVKLKGKLKTPSKLHGKWIRDDGRPSGYRLWILKSDVKHWVPGAAVWSW